MSELCGLWRTVALLTWLSATACTTVSEVPAGADTSPQDDDGVTTASPTTSGEPPTDATSTTAGTDGGNGTSCTNDAQCDDGLFCTGLELCRPQMEGSDVRGCLSSAAPCTPPLVCSEAGGACLAPCEEDPDADDDGFDSVECGGDDCDDTDPGVHPGADEVCDDVDDDCDPSTVGPDGSDGDGAISSACCNPDGRGGTVCGTDCNDRVEGSELGTWFECSTCGVSCGTRQGCDEGQCSPARRIFVTDATFAADLGGEAGADERCQNAADAEGLGGTWRAFLVETADGLDRFETATVAYVRLDGERVADSWTDLTDDSIAAPVEVSETLRRITGNAWTGISDLNTPGAVDCLDWTSTQGGCLGAGPCGAAGQTYETDTHWDGYFVYNCTDLYHLYCVEQ